jgi:hypothetical protein
MILHSRTITVTDPNAPGVCGWVAYVNIPGVGWSQENRSYYYPNYPPPPYPGGYWNPGDTDPVSGCGFCGGLMAEEINSERPDPAHLEMYLALGVDNNHPVSLPQVGSLDFYTYGNGSDVGPCNRTTAATFFASCGPIDPAVPQKWGSIPVYLEDISVVSWLPSMISEMQ